jgi:hypothetical protein
MRGVRPRPVVTKPPAAASVPFGLHRDINLPPVGQQHANVEYDPLIGWQVLRNIRVEHFGQIDVSAWFQYRLEQRNEQIAIMGASEQ